MPLLAAWSIAGLLRLLEGHRKFVCSKDTAKQARCSLTRDIAAQQEHLDEDG